MSALKYIPAAVYLRGTELVGVRVASDEIDAPVQHMDAGKREIGVGPDVVMPPRSGEVVER